MRVSISGLGVMGKNHLRVCKSLGYEIVSTFDPERGDNYQDFLKTLASADALIIASPTRYHLQGIIDAIEHNPDIKILCEKPVCFSTSEEEIANVIQHENSVLIGQIERFNPSVIKLKKELLNKEIIQIKTRRVNNVPAREKIDCRKDIGIHDLDFVCNILDEFPEQIGITSNDQNSHEVLVYKIGDVIAINEVSWEYPFKSRDFEVLTSDGVYSGNFYEQSLFFNDWTGNESKIEVDKKEPLISEISHLEAMVSTGTDPLVTISSNLKILKLMGY